MTARHACHRKQRRIFSAANGSTWTTMVPVSGEDMNLCPASLSHRTTAGRMRGRPPTLCIPLPVAHGCRDWKQLGKARVALHEDGGVSTNGSGIWNWMHCCSPGIIPSGLETLENADARRTQRCTGDDGQGNAVRGAVGDACQALDVVLQLRQCLLHQHAVQVHLWTSTSDMVNYCVGLFVVWRPKQSEKQVPDSSILSSWRPTILGSCNVHPKATTALDVVLRLQLFHRRVPCRNVCPQTCTH